MRKKSCLIGVRVVLGLTLVLLAVLSLAQRADAAGSSWRGEYYANKDLIGSATLVRSDSSIDFNWGKGSPDPSIPRNYFSVRWTRELHLSKGRYRFYTKTDDGVRLYVDGHLLINKWQQMTATTYSGEINLSQGDHAIRMEYFEYKGSASARLWWERVGGTSKPDGAWKGQYFSNPWLSAPPVFERYDERINFDWGQGSPDPRIPADHFSIRWTRKVDVKEGRYTFYVEADDGVRLFLDGRLIIDDWREGPARTIKKVRTLSKGKHTIRLEYYEHTGDARIRFWWTGKEKASRPIGNLITCMRPYDSWIKIFRKMSDGSWQDINPHGWGPIEPTGYIKIDGLPAEDGCNGNGACYRVELWVSGSLIRTAGDTDHGQPEFRIYSRTDNYTPWGCPVP